MSVQSVGHRILSIFLLVAMGAGLFPVHALAPTELAAVTVPDVPDPTSFQPVPMRSIAPADPGAKIHLIEAPQADYKGDARLSFPLEVPPGRLGMQPDLVIEYVSSAGNGWLGLGWDLPLSTIGIDTRWGVPRYDSQLETETYLFNGEQLTPLAHRGEPQKRSAGDKRFHLRVEGEFHKIIRHGTNPGDYWWEVTDRLGTVYTYGGPPNDVCQPSSNPDSDTILTDMTVSHELNQGHIFLWALREVRDTYGNSIQYCYTRVPDTGLEGGVVPGHQLYPQSIYYTGHAQEAGPYKVEFIRSHGRPDVIIDARGGFKQVTADLLHQIDVTYRGDLVRRYEFEYETGPFVKSLLISIRQYGENGAEFHTHRFDYYDDIYEQQTNTYQGFRAPTTWEARDDDVTRFLLDDVHASALGGSNTLDADGHLYLGFNPFSSDKDLSIGGKIGYRYGSSDGLLELIDIDGDNLPDKVFVDSGTVHFRANQSGPHGTATFADTQAPPQVPGLNAISEEQSDMLNGGPEIYVGAGYVYNASSTFSEQSVYFADVNGDGLLDLVDGGQVLFNRLMDGVPTFAFDSEGTRVPIAPGTVDADNLLGDYTELFEKFIDTYPLHDTLIRWLAPYDGQVRITGPVALAESAACSQYETADGVVVSVQLSGTTLWTVAIPAADHSPIVPTGLDSISVQAGDRIYFRVQSVFDGACDQVNWDPDITYLDVPQAVDANLLDPYRYNLSADFVLAGRRDMQVTMPFTGTVRLQGSLEKRGTTTDDVSLLVIKNQGELLFSEALAWDETGGITPTLDIEVIKDDTILLRVKADSPIDLTQIQWVPELFYIEAEGVPVVTDQDGRYTLQLNPPYDIDSYPVEEPVPPLSGPQEPWIAPYTGTVTVTAHLLVSPLQYLPFGTLPGGTAVFTIKRSGERLAKHIVDIPELAPFPTPPWWLPRVFSVPPLSIEVDAGDQVFFDFSVHDLGLIDNFGFSQDVDVTYPIPLNPAPQPGTEATPGHSSAIDRPYRVFLPAVLQTGGAEVPNSLTETVPSALHFSAHPGLFALPYRGWAYAGYNGNRDRADQPIHESDLERSFDENSTYDPSSAKAYPFIPVPSAAQWRGPDELGWVSAGQISSSRLGMDYFDVPRPEDLSGARAVSRLSRTEQDSHTLGIGQFAYSWPGAMTTSQSRLDYLDMNGDLFPDVVGWIETLEPDPSQPPLSDDVTDQIPGYAFDRVVFPTVFPPMSHLLRVQYSTPAGGLEPASQPVEGLNHLRESDNPTESWGLGGTVAHFRPSGRGQVNNSPGNSAKGNKTGNLMASFGLTYNRTEGTSDTLYDLIDVNGDGLPDLVASGAGGLTVALNLGYRFATPEPWGVVAIHEGSSRDQAVGVNFGVGFNDGKFEFAGGPTYNWNGVETARSLVDVNGDGLVDWVTAGGNHLGVRFNTGNAFADEATWTGALTRPLNSSKNYGLGGGLYFTFGIGPLCLVGCYIIVNPGADVIPGLVRTESDLRDLDGDGYVDHVYTDRDSYLDVATNQTGYTNLLKTIQRPLGATIHLEYAREGNTYDLPQSRWVLSQVTVDDGVHLDDVSPGDGVDEQVTTYLYEAGVYDLWEREFYGFQAVSEAHLDPGDDGQYRTGDDSVYRTTRREFHNDRYFTRGLLKKQIVAGGEFSDGHLYLETEYTYSLHDVEQGNGAVFPALTRVDHRFYEGQASAEKWTAQEYVYDQWGNVIRMSDWADSGSQDDLEVVVDYFENLDKHIIAQARRLVVFGDGTEMRRQEVTLWEPDTGAVRQISHVLADGSAAVTDMDHDQFGNVNRVTGPANYKGQRYSLAYTYDDQVHTHLIRIEDSFGYVSTASYNLKHGQVESVTDVNGNAMNYTYDPFGRPVTVVGPYQAGTGLYTLQFDYSQEAGPSEVPWALTRQIDVYRDANDPIETVVFVDGLERVIQVKKDASLHTGVAGNAQDRMIISGATVFDFVGRPVDQYYPTTEDLGSQGTYNPGADAIPPTISEYDVLDRLTKVTIPDGTSTQYQYSFGLDRQAQTRFQTRVTDANGIPKEIYRDVRGLITAMKEFNDGGSQVIWTSYGYDPLRQIVRVVDDQENVTLAYYDNLGRRTHLFSPDGGLVETVYDLASNPIQRIPSSLRAKGQAILHDYDYNRLTNITYPDFPENNVAYAYGSPGATHNRASRVVTVADESGLEEFFYGPLGEIVRTIKTVASDTLGDSPNSPEVYTSDYLYDTWNQLQMLTYPDGEVLTYEYDSGGQLRAASGSKGGHLYAYLDRMEYDQFQDPVFVQVGNKVRTVYAYNSLNRSLEVIQTGQALGHGTLFHDLRLSYDNVGNVTAQANLAPDPAPSQMGGATYYSYVYDDLNRLVHAAGTFDYEPDTQHRYQLDIVYDTIHNITAKTQAHQVREPSGVLVEQHETTYSWQYAYAGPQPHAATNIGQRTFLYDADGNQAGWEHDQNGTRRTIVWDEESRIQSISDVGHTMTYKYNAAGERVIKRGPQGETVYVNPFFTIRNREVAIKHVYGGGMRLVSKLMAQDKPGANPQGYVPLEKDLYFYHPDHLGTSMYVTDARGDLYEHLEYFPFGETFVEESSNTQRTPYLFTAKELDEETELYYFGARYYDPVTSLWQSPDPLLGDYLPTSGADDSLPGLGGIYNSRNLGLYGYAFQNPVTYRDVEGRSTVLARAPRVAGRRAFMPWLLRRFRTRGYPKGEVGFQVTVGFVTVTKSRPLQPAEHGGQIAITLPFPVGSFSWTQLRQADRATWAFHWTPSMQIEEFLYKLGEHRQREGPE